VRWAALAATLLGCSVELGVSEQSIIGGAPAPDERAVVGLSRHATSCTPSTLIDCSATLVAPRLVVTAAHCLGLDPPNVYQVFFGAAVEQGGELIDVVGGHAHPGFDATTFANDIAALILARDAPAGVTPVSLNRALADLTGTDVTLVGFGITALDAQDTGTRNAGTARVVATGPDEIDLEPAPAIACAGDSGGPVLAAGELIAVSTHGDAACAEIGHALRVDRQQAFLAPILAEAAAAATRGPFDADESLCEQACSADADCPANTVCFASRCVYRGLPPGTFAESCPGGDAPCITVPDGSCRRYAACTTDEGCGCRTSSHAPVWWLVIAWLIRKRGSRR
jgi:secreted trypsin-like serine protease